MVSNLETRAPVMELTEIERLQTAIKSLQNENRYLWAYVGEIRQQVTVDGAKYWAKVEPDMEDGGFVVQVPGLPGCVTQGESIEEALENAEEAIRMWRRARKEADHE
jgi:predicted RNase H-like HicB family nuclease